MINLAFGIACGQIAILAMAFARLDQPVHQSKVYVTKSQTEYAEVSKSYLHKSPRGFAMSVNVGSTDRILRLIVGIILLCLPFTVGFASTFWTAVSIIVGLVMLGTAVMRFCLMYTLFGIKTCRTK